MMTDEEFEEMKRWGKEKTVEMEAFLNTLRQQFRGMTKEELHQRFSMIDDETLKWICVDIALPTEDYEVCQMAKQVLNERGKPL